MDEIDCSFVDGNMWFGFKACGILIDDSKVLAVNIAAIHIAIR